MIEEQIKELAKSVMLETIKENLDSAMIFTYIEGLKQEIERLNNIIKELEKWCNESIYDDDQLYENVLDKLQELKGSDKE